MKKKTKIKNALKKDPCYTVKKMLESEYRRKTRKYRKKVKLNFQQKFEQMEREFYETHEYRTIAIVNPKFAHNFLKIDSFVTVCNFGRMIRPLIEGEIGKCIGYSVIVDKNQKQPILLKIQKVYRFKK